MQLKTFFSKWTKIAGLLLMGGALAWTIKLGIIVSTNGRIINSGSAALFMRIGLLLLFIGSTGIGNRLSAHRHLLLRITAILLSPVVVFGSIFLLGMLTGPMFENSSLWYARFEAPIGFAVLLYVTVGYFLYKSHKPVTRLA
jgi:hypothetical protein